MDTLILNTALNKRCGCFSIVRNIGFIYPNVYFYFYLSSIQESFSLGFFIHIFLFNFCRNQYKHQEISKMDNSRIFKTPFASIYPLYIQKVEKKGRTQAELDEIIIWLTGYNKQALQEQIDCKSDFETFFNQAPQLNPNVSKITGVICGYRVEEIEDKLMQKIRYLDKLVDELAKGRKMEKILRK